MSPPSSNVFANAHAFIQHANGHIDEAAAIAKSFFDTEPYETIRVRDRRHPGYTIEYMQLAKPLPFRVSGLASDAAMNLRSILDHIGFAVATASGNRGKNAHFPFGDNLEQLISRQSKQSKDIPTEIFDLMVSFKPYQGGNDALWRLNKLANTNKHEITVRPVLAARELTYEGNGMWLNVGSRKAVGDKIPVAWISPDDPGPYMKPKIDPEIRFNDVGELLFDQPAIALLRNMSSVVKRIVSSIEAESKKLGIIA